MQNEGKNYYWGKILKQYLIGFQVQQKNFSLPRKAKGRYLQVTFQLQNTQGCWKMKVRLVFAHFRIEVSVSFLYVRVFMRNCLSGEDCCSVSDTGGSYENSSTPRRSSRELAHSLTEVKLSKLLIVLSFVGFRPCGLRQNSTGCTDGAHVRLPVHQDVHTGKHDWIY